MKNWRFSTNISFYFDKKLSCRRDHATKRVIKYFAKSFKVIRNDTLEYSVCTSILLFH